MTPALLMLPTGCQSQPATDTPVRVNPLVVVVTPVINLSNDARLDVLRLTDWVASEIVGEPTVNVMPLNMTLAELALRGMDAVASPEEARDIARRLGADATLVTAVTEYDPFDPMRIGLIMQWYSVREPQQNAWSPVAASRQAADNAAPPIDGPGLQVQRTFSTADEDVLDEVKDYANEREGLRSAFGWRRWTKSQELFFRYCAWSTFRTMLTLPPEEH